MLNLANLGRRRMETLGVGAVLRGIARPFLHVANWEHPYQSTEYIQPLDDYGHDGRHGFAPPPFVGWHATLENGADLDAQIAFGYEVYIDNDYCSEHFVDPLVPSTGDIWRSGRVLKPGTGPVDCESTAHLMVPRGLCIAPDDLVGFLEAAGIFPDSLSSVGQHGNYLVTFQDPNMAALLDGQQVRCSGEQGVGCGVFRMWDGFKKHGD